MTNGSIDLRNSIQAAPKVAEIHKNIENKSLSVDQQTKQTIKDEYESEAKRVHKKGEATKVIVAEAYDEHGRKRQQQNQKDDNENEDSEDRVKAQDSQDDADNKEHDVRKHGKKSMVTYSKNGSKVTSSDSGNGFINKKI